MLFSLLILLLRRLELGIEVASVLLYPQLATGRLRHSRLHAVVAKVEAGKVVISGTIHLTRAIIVAIFQSLFVLKSRLHALHD